MDALPPTDRLVACLKEALTIADQLGLVDVSINVDRAINQLGGNEHFLADSAARIWVLPD